MSKLITVSTGSIDYKENKINNRSGYREITITNTGSEVVTGTITAPAGAFIEHPETGVLVSSYNFTIESSYTPFTTRIHTYDVTGLTGDFQTLDLNFAIDEDGNYYSAAVENNNGRLYIEKYNSQMEFQAACYIGEMAVNCETGKIAVVGDFIIVGFPALVASNRINVLTKIDRSTMAVVLAKKYTTITDYYGDFRVVVPDPDGNILAAGICNFGGDIWGMIARIQVSDLSVLECVRIEEECHPTNILIDDSGNFELCGFEKVGVNRRAFYVLNGVYDDLDNANTKLAIQMGGGIATYAYYYYDLAKNGSDLYVCGSYYDDVALQTYGIIGKQAESPAYVYRILPLYSIWNTDTTIKVYIHSLLFEDGYCYASGYVNDIGASTNMGLILKIDTATWSIVTAKHIQYTGPNPDAGVRCRNMTQLNGRFFINGAYSLKYPPVVTIYNRHMIFIADPVNNDNLVSVPTNFTYTDVTSSYNIKTTDNGLGEALEETQFAPQTLTPAAFTHAEEGTDSGVTATYYLA
jgi:hypothetical protein